MFPFEESDKILSKRKFGNTVEKKLFCLLSWLINKKGVKKRDWFKNK